jgi:hypothetical protein
VDVIGKIALAAADATLSVDILVVALHFRNSCLNFIL